MPSSVHAYVARTVERPVSNPADMGSSRGQA
ncbi:hypothetical protein AVEN_168838-1, partial [Araneus ventricosus]